MINASQVLRIKSVLEACFIDIKKIIVFKPYQNFTFSRFSIISLQSFALVLVLQTLMTWQTLFMIMPLSTKIG